MGLDFDLAVGNLVIVGWHDNKFIVIIISSVYYSDTYTRKFFERFINTQNIGIDLLVIGSLSFWRKAIVNRIEKTMLRMLTSQRPIYFLTLIIWFKYLE